MKVKRLVAVVTVSIFVVAALATTGCTVTFGNSSSSNNPKSTAVNVDEAVDFNLDAVKAQYSENEKRAKQEWEGKTVKLTVPVEYVADDHVIGTIKQYLETIEIYLPDEDLLKLNKGDVITVAGIFNGDVFMPKLQNAVLIEKK